VSADTGASFTGAAFLSGFSLLGFAVRCFLASDPPVWVEPLELVESVIVGSTLDDVVEELLEPPEPGELESDRPES
jgi:hypothetical protein